MELAMSQVSFRNPDNASARTIFTPERTAHFMESMYAVASADGEVSEEELVEIRQIARELGFPADEIAQARAARV